MKRNPRCPRCKSHEYKKFGSYYRKSDRLVVPRFRCLQCARTFSRDSDLPEVYSKIRHLYPMIKALLCSKVSMRRVSLFTGLDRKTVNRALYFLSAQAKKHQEFILNTKYQKRISRVQFDDQETSLHTKCRPVSIALMVEHPTRFIIAAQASLMPANGLLSKISKAKYGIIPDERKKTWDTVFKNIKPYLSEKCVFESDQHSTYRSLIQAHFSQSVRHIQHKGRKPRDHGQGELKRGGFDPLFSINHTCAMLRDNVSRLVRKTWCTSKTLKGLQAHLNLYVDFHNTVLIQKKRMIAPRNHLMSGIRI